MLRRVSLAAGIAAGLAAGMQLAGCAEAPPPADYDAGLGTPESPVPGTAAYAVRSRVHLPLESPDVTAAITNLHSFSTGGGAQLLVETAGTPSAHALTGLPASLETNLRTWIDVELDKQTITTVTARRAVGQIADMATSVVDGFVIDSALAITPSGARHTLTGLTFEPASLQIVVPVGGLGADKLDQDLDATVAATGALELGDHAFSLAFGSHAWQGINLASQTAFDGDLSVIEQLDCDRVAQSVAARCVSGTCVGHASDLVTVCKTGLTSLVDRLRDALAPIEMDTLRLASGSATLVDDNRDGVADRIIDGTWHLEADAGMGVQTAQVTFTAGD